MKHGDSTTSEYFIWIGMRQRCENERNAAYKYYGGRGITVCSEWADYRRFISDMGRRPSPKHSIDRIDNDSGYRKDNCRWALRSVQTGNRRMTLRVDGMTIREISVETGLTYSGIYGRLRRGWSPHDILNSPRGNNGYRSTNVLITSGGETLCASRWAERAGLSIQTIIQRLANGLSHDDVVRPGKVIRLGEAKPNAKLTEALVSYIRSSEKSGRELSRELGVSDALIYSVRARRSWASVP